ncbi:MAG: non-homologous end-joining DNA ligase [Nocardioidaceae bacterium]
MAKGSALEVDGRRVALSNLDKVLYPADGTTKHDVVAHYLAMADVILPQLADRPLTRKRWPDGVTGTTAFFEKNLPRGAPPWLRTVTLDSPGSSKDREQITYPVLEDRAGLIWVANLAALELHAPQWRVGGRGSVRPPDRLVIDLDPGPPAGLADCAEIALLVRERLAVDGFTCIPVTSGSKGLQLYASTAGRQDASVVRDYVHAIARELEHRHPERVLSRMTRAIRTGKVLLDWSQNSSAKTTIVPYSLRGRERAWVATPRTWDELADSGSLQQVHRSALPGRLDSYGDLLTTTDVTDAPRVPVDG